MRWIPFVFAATACSHGGARPAPSRLAVDVWTDRGARSPQLAHDAIAMPLARALAREPDVGHVTTTTDARGVHVTAWIAGGIDRSDIFTRLRARVEAAQHELPDDADPAIETRELGPVVRVIVRRPHGSLVELRSWVDWQLEREARMTVGVSDATACGGLDARVVVTVDPRRLAEYGAALQDVAQALRHGADPAPGGALTAGGDSIVIRSLGTLQDVAQVTELRVPVHGVTVDLGQVAAIEDTGVPDPCRDRAPDDAVVLDVRLRRDADPGAVLDAIRRAEAAAPAGTTFEIARAPVWFDVALAGRADPAAALAPGWRAAIAGAPGVVGVAAAAPPVTTWRPDPAAAARAGVMESDLDDVIAALDDGTEVLDLYRGDQRIPIWLRAATSDPALVTVRGGDGGLVPLTALAQRASGPGRIDTLDQLPATIVRFAVADGDDADAIAGAAIDRARAAAPPPADVSVTSWREP